MRSRILDKKIPEVCLAALRIVVRRTFAAAENFTEKDMLESQIRDLLASQLSCLSPALTLVDKEKYIPDNIGTRSFVDLVARSSQGEWVLIELKRSDSAARQAIHEVNKYVESVKRHLGARDDEIIVFVVSTVWTELLSPFSRFVADTSISVRGFALDVSHPHILAADPIQPLAVSGGRALAPWHELNTYRNKKSLTKGITSYERSCGSKGIEDFLLVVLKAHKDFAERAEQATRAALREIHSRFGNIDEREINEVISKIGKSEYILYFVPQLLAEEFCLKILEKDESAYKEAEDVLRGIDGEEALLYLHECVYAMSPCPFRDHLEIGNAAKFKCKLLEQERWTVQEVLRYGAFKRNSLLTDDVLIEEIGGSTGSSGQRFKRSIDLDNKAQYEGAVREIKECLQNNPLWLADILQALDESRHDYPDAKAEINIYNPTAGLFTIFFAATRSDGFLNLPVYGINILCPKHLRGYYGEMGGQLSP